MAALVAKNLKNVIMKKLFFAFALVALAVSLLSCNVTRVVTTTSQYCQKGDTTITIQTKTIESYDATRKTL